MTICSAVLIQYQRVTDRRTDVQPISITCFNIADTRKNEWSQSVQTWCKVWPWDNLEMTRFWFFNVTCYGKDNTTAIWHGFEFSECLLVNLAITAINFVRKYVVCIQSCWVVTSDALSHPIMSFLGVSLSNLTPVWGGVGKGMHAGKLNNSILYCT